MKTCIIRTSLIILFSVVIFSTAQSQSKWTYGLNGGFNFSWVDVEVVTGEPFTGEFSSRLSYTAGLYGEYGFNDRMFLQIGFNIDQRGFKYKESGDNSSVDITVKAPYFEIPFLFRYSFLKKETFALYGLAGPSIAFLVGGKIKGEQTDDTGTYPIDYKLTDSHNSTDAGLKVGLGAEFPFAEEQGAVFVDARYNWGFTDHIRQGGYYESANLNANSNVVSIIVGVRGYIE